MKERDYQARLIKKVKERFPDCIVLKNDANYLQGIPDLVIFEGRNWAALETKRSSSATHRPNQDYYVNKMNGMSFASFIFPENEEEVLNGLEQTLKRP